MTRRTLRPAALLLLGVLLLSACSDPATPEDGGEEAAVPEGWEVVEGAGFSVAAPPDWTVETPEQGIVDLVGPEGPLDARVRVRAGAPEGISPEESIDVLTLGMDLELDDITRDGEPEEWSPAGAREGAVQRISYTQTVDGEPLEIAELTAVAVGDGVQVVVRALDRADRFADVEPVLQQVLDTVVLLDDVAPADGEA